MRTFQIFSQYQICIWSSQSAYKCYHHSTETALVRVHYDILKTVDDNKSVILLLLHLSAAFDTVDYTILVSRLANRFGISETALNWFGSNLQLRKQFVTVNGIDSALKDLQYGVLQGSCVSSFTVFTLHKSGGWYSQKAWHTISSVCRWNTIISLVYVLLP